MTRILPTTWTAIYVAFASAATWFLCESDALGGVAPLFFH